MWGIVGVVVLLVVVGGLIYSGRNRGKLTQEQEQQWKQTYANQYRQFTPPQSGR